MSNDILIAAKGYTLYSSSNNGSNWKRHGKIKDGINSLFAITRFTSRLTRAEISKLYYLTDGTELCIARKGIFRREKGEKRFSKCYDVIRGSRPICLLEDESTGNVYFGEYFRNYEKVPVHIFCSEDRGKSWQVAYTFPEGWINHIHGIFKDPYTGALWVATGDRENECVIGYTTDGFKTFNIIHRGAQDYRTCVLFFYPDYVLYATDSQYQQCYVKSIDRATNEVKEIHPVQGPVIRGCEFGGIVFIATDIEPSKFNKETHAYVWMSQDGHNWKQLFKGEKDILSATYFQFGTFDLPVYSPDYKGRTLYISGKALKKYDGNTIEIDIIN